MDAEPRQSFAVFETGLARRRSPGSRLDRGRYLRSFGTSFGAWLALAASLAAYGIVSVAAHGPFHEGARALSFFDLRTYRGTALRVLDGTALYRRPILHGLGMTYPPFAGLLFAPLGWVSLTVDEIIVTAANVGLLVWMLRRALLLPMGPQSRFTGMLQDRSAWSLAALAAAAAVWLEPISVTLGYGQINLLIAALVVFDLSRPDGARTKGAAIGLAAAIKLTPLLFIVYLLFSARRRAAAVGTGVFAASIALSGVLLRRDAAQYWGGRFLQSSRVGNGTDAADQSLRGALLRLTGEHGGTSPQIALIVLLVTLFGLGLAVVASRRGDEAAGYSLAALATLLASPISWTHHWTLAVPALFLLVRRARESRSRALAAGAAALACVGYSYLPEHVEGRARPSGAITLLTCDPYVMAALAVLVLVAVVFVRQERAAGLVPLESPA